MNFVQNFGAVIAFAAFIADTNRHMFKNNHPFSMPEHFPLHNVFPHDAITVFASITGNRFFFFINHLIIGMNCQFVKIGTNTVTYSLQNSLFHSPLPFNFYFALSADGFWLMRELRLR